MWQRFLKLIPLLGLALLLCQCGQGIGLDVLDGPSGGGPLGGGQGQPSMDDAGADHQEPTPMDDGDPFMDSFKAGPGPGDGDGDDDPEINDILDGEFADQMTD